MAELRWRLAATEKRRGGGGRLARLRVLRVEAAAARLAGPRARGRGFIGQLKGLDVPARGAVQARRHRAVAELGLESEPRARSGKTPMGGAHLAVRERNVRRGAPVGLAGPRGGCREKEKASWAGPYGRKGREGTEALGWLGRVEEKEKVREKMGRAKRRKGNAFKYI
jgi:hypothetical protein